MASDKRPPVEAPAPDVPEWIEPIPDTFDNIVRATVGVRPSPNPIRPASPTDKPSN